MRPLWMLEIDLDADDCRRQKDSYWPDVVAIVAAVVSAVLIVAGATAAAVWLW